MINYKHLSYFWTVAHEGSISKASERLHVTPQTISGQLSMLEDTLGEALFHRRGRSLQITDAGRLALRYADEIFALGGELETAIKASALQPLRTFRVGIADVVPKIVAYRLLAPALELDERIKLVAREGAVENLLAELALHRLDMVLAERPIPANINIRGHNHLLGECSTSFFATADLAETLDKPFPQNISEAPVLLPGEATVARGRLLRWFDKHKIRPHIVGEFDDGALMKAFGEAGTGIFVSPTAIADEVIDRYGVVHLGATQEVVEQYYAISAESRVTDPAIQAINSAARTWLTDQKISADRPNA